jgi:hypothetical protein
MTAKQKPRLSEESARIALERSDGFCADGCGRQATAWHHIFDQKRWPALVSEPDNLMPVAAPCHSAHTNAHLRLPRFACASAERLAVTPQMERYLDSHYDDRRLL